MGAGKNADFGNDLANSFGVASINAFAGFQDCAANDFCLKQVEFFRNFVFGISSVVKADAGFADSVQQRSGLASQHLV